MAFSKERWESQEEASTLSEHVYVVVALFAIVAAEDDDLCAICDGTVTTAWLWWLLSNDELPFVLHLMK